MYYIWSAEVRAWRGRPAYCEMREFRKDWYNVIDVFACDPFRGLLPPRLEFDMYGSGGGLPDHISSATFQPMSERLAGLVRATGVIHEEVPASIYSKKAGKLLSGEYTCMHIMNCTGAVDLLRSEGEVKTNREGRPYLSRIRRLILRPEIEAAGIQIFRLREARNLVLVHEEFKSRYEAEGLWGSRFEPIEEYDETVGWGRTPRF